MKPPHLRLVKGYGMSPQEPDELEAAIKRYLLTKQALAEATIKHYRKVLKTYRGICPDWPPDQVTIVKFIAYCQESYEDNTIQVYWTVLKMFVTWLVKRELIVDDPFEDMAPPTRPDDLPRAPAIASLKTLFGYLENRVEGVLAKKKRPTYWGWREVRNLTLYSLLLDTGLRISEVVGVQLEDVSLEDWSVFVRHAKRKRQRYVAIGHTARADLRLWLKYRELIPLKSGSPGLPYLFLAYYRDDWIPISLSNIEDTLQRKCALLNIEPAFTPHHLRHAYCSYSIDRGGSIEAIRLQMGHANLATTARYAKRVDPERLKNHLKTSPRDYLF